MKRLVLLGGGHAHLHVLAALARQRLATTEVVLITPYPALVYSGMVPGLVAGLYSPQACQIALAPLAAAAGVRLVQASATAMDAAQRRLWLSDGGSARYDVLSVDTGAEQARDSLPGAREHAVFVRPVEQFLALQQALLDGAAQRGLALAVVGAGAAGFELALALQHRLRERGGERASVALVTGGPEPLAGYPAAVLRRAAQVLAQQGVAVVRERVVAVEEGALQLGSGTRLACHRPLIATGVQAPDWLQGSGLALCGQGFVQTTATLQSPSNPEVFAAGDVATPAGRPRPRSGVYAVRAGAPLAANLRRFLEGAPLAPYQAPSRTLNLLSCGDRTAIATWGRWSAQGAWAWRWKDRIDRAFIARFTVAIRAA